MARAGRPIRPKSRVPLARLALAYWRLSRPEIWMVSALPTYVGWLLGGRELVPAQSAWMTLGAPSTWDGSTITQALAAAWSSATAGVELGLALLVMGPLLWTATLLINDVHDLPGDRMNPRKARSPLVQGIVDVGAARTGAYVAGALAAAAAAPVGPTFIVLTLACLLLAWLYSVPPVRLKERPGADVAVNAVGIGALALLAGWSVAAPLASFPWPMLVQGLLIGIAVYVPTTLVDHDADRAAGYLTLATHLGPRLAYRIGWWAWVACNLGALLLSATDTVLLHGFFPLLVVFVPVLLVQYHVMIGRARDPVEMVRGIVLGSLTFLAVNLVFALQYVGLLT